MKPKIKHQKLDPKKNPELKALAQLVGEFIEYWGFKSVHGKMWCYLYLAQEPLDSRQLANLLKISPALVTQSIQVLLKYRVIFEVEKGKNGVLRFVANSNVTEAIGTVLQGREVALLNQIQVAQSRLATRRPPGTDDLPLSQERVVQVGQWVMLANLLLKSGINALGQPDGPFDQPKEFAKSIQQKFL
jgi:hypothetical protein